MRLSNIAHMCGIQKGGVASSGMLTLPPILEDLTPWGKQSVWHVAPEPRTGKCAMEASAGYVMPLGPVFFIAPGSRWPDVRNCRVLARFAPSTVREGSEVVRGAPAQLCPHGRSRNGEAPKERHFHLADWVLLPAGERATRPEVASGQFRSSLHTVPTRRPNEG